MQMGVIFAVFGVYVSAERNYFVVSLKVVGYIFFRADVQNADGKIVGRADSRNGCKFNVFFFADGFKGRKNFFADPFL